MYRVEWHRRTGRGERCGCGALLLLLLLELRLCRHVPSLAASGSRGSWRKGKEMDRLMMPTQEQSMTLARVQTHLCLLRCARPAPSGVWSRLVSVMLLLSMRKCPPLAPPTEGTDRRAAALFLFLLARHTHTHRHTQSTWVMLVCALSLALTAWTASTFPPLLAPESVRVWRAGGQAGRLDASPRPKSVARTTLHTTGKRDAWMDALPARHSPPPPPIRKEREEQRAAGG